MLLRRYKAILLGRFSFYRFFFLPSSMWCDFQPFLHYFLYTQWCYVYTNTCRNRFYQIVHNITVYTVSFNFFFSHCVCVCVYTWGCSLVTLLFSFFGLNAICIVFISLICHHPSNHFFCLLVYSMVFLTAVNNNNENRCDTVDVRKFHFKPFRWLCTPSKRFSSISHC